MNAPVPHKAKGKWYLVRRVPAEFTHLDPRKIVRISTGIRITDDPRGIAARSVVDRLDASLVQHWQALRDAPAGAAIPPAPFEEVKRLARRRGFEYLPAAELAGGNLEYLLGRLESLEFGDRIEKPVEVAAALGGVEPPTIRLSRLFDEYERIMRGSLEGMSATQRRKWPAQYKQAVKNLIKLIGDKPIAKITRNDALELREHWQGRIAREKMNVSSANRDIGAMSKMMRTVNDTKRLGLTMVFDGLRIGGMKKGRRKPFAAGHVQNVLLAEGTFDDLNDEARRIVYLITETGLRPSEAVNLTRETIKIGAAVPHVQIRPEGRILKAASSERDIPLVGVALEVMKLHPDGFPRYRDNADALSALVNKSMLDRKLRTADQSLYSLRHSFEDRLTAVEAPEKVVAYLMGHAWHRPKYGAGPMLPQLEEWLKKIAFRAPARI